MLPQWITAGDRRLDTQKVTRPFQSLLELFDESRKVRLSLKGIPLDLASCLRYYSLWAKTEQPLAYLAVASGSIPLLLMASQARVEARKSTSRLEPLISPEPATTAAEKTCTNWISGAMLPAKSMPAACRISLTGMTARFAPPTATMPAASAPRGIALTLIFSAMPS